MGVGPFTVELDDTTYGAICLALYWQDAPNFEDLANLLPPDFFLGFSLNSYENDPDGNPRPVSVLSMGPEKMQRHVSPAVDRLTAPLNFCDRADPNCGTSARVL